MCRSLNKNGSIIGLSIWVFFFLIWWYSFGGLGGTTVLEKICHWPGLWQLGDDIVLWCFQFLFSTSLLCRRWKRPVSCSCSHACDLMPGLPTKIDSVEPLAPIKCLKVSLVILFCKDSRNLTKYFIHQLYILIVIILKALYLCCPV